MTFKTFHIFKNCSALKCLQSRNKACIKVTGKWKFHPMSIFFQCWHARPGSWDNFVVFDQRRIILQNCFWWQRQAFDFDEKFLISMALPAELLTVPLGRKEHSPSLCTFIPRRKSIFRVYQSIQRAFSSVRWLSALRWDSFFRLLSCFICNTKRTGGVWSQQPGLWFSLGEWVSYLKQMWI